MLRALALPPLLARNPRPHWVVGDGGERVLPGGGVFCCGDAVTPADLLGLAERCEQASADKPNEAVRFRICCEIEALIFDNHSGMMRWFTDSIDAAMTLVPEGFSCGAGTAFYDRKGWAYCVPYGASGFQNRDAATPALALCAAALRARAATMGGDK